MRRIFLTLDFEEDGGSVSQLKTYYCHSQSLDFIQFVRKHNLKVTLFITGEILNQRRELLAPYIAAKDFFQFEIHANNHEDVYNPISDRINNIRKGLNAYTHFFQKTPRIYRAPDGIISRKEIEFLVQNKIYYGSSIFPTFIPGRFNNLRFPRTPFKVYGLDFTEIPFTTTKILRMPIALSYIQLFGFPFFKTLMLFEKPADIVFDFHLHDMYPKEWYSKHKLPLIPKLAYYRAAFDNYAWTTFVKTLAFFKRNEYRFEGIHTLLDELDEDSLREFSFE